MAEPHPTDRLVRELQRLYGDAYQRILERLAEAIREGRSPAFYRAWLQQIREELARLGVDTAEWAMGDGRTPGAIEASWSDGAEAAMQEFERAGRPLAASFAQPHRDAIQVAAENLLVSLDDALRTAGGQVQGWLNAAAVLAGGDGVSLIGRRVQDELRRAGLEATARKLTEGLTVRDMRRILLDDLTQRGLTAITDQAGRNWSLPAYAEMVARTTTREAYTQGTLRVVQRTGHDLVRASTHWPTCSICGARQGRIYSISGRTPGWPALSTVGPTPWHPNCLIAGQVVTTARGSIPIEQIQVGMYVLTHTSVYRPVVRIFRRNYEGEAIRITVKGRTVVATPEHPFLTRRGWVEAKDLLPDDEVLVEEA